MDERKMTINIHKLLKQFKNGEISFGIVLQRIEKSTISTIAGLRMKYLSEIRNTKPKQDKVKE